MDLQGKLPPAGRGGISRAGQAHGDEPAEARPAACTLTDDLLRSERVLIRWLFRHALRRGHAPAWRDTDAPCPVSWSELTAAVLAAADRLRSAGVAPGNRVVTALANGRPAAWGALALQAVGAVEAPLGSHVDGTAIAQHMQRIGARCCLIDASRDDHRQTLGQRCLMLETCWDAASLPARCDDVADALRATDAIDPSTPALILRTSGTSSAPRDVVLSWHALASNAAGKLAAAPQSDQDIRLTVLPLAHAYARTCDLGTWLISGGTLAASHGWQGLCEAAPQVRPTVMNLVPSLAQRLLTSIASDAVSREPAMQALTRLGLDRLRLLGCGGAALAPEDFDAFRSLGITVIQGYGLTEAGPVICSASPDDARCGSVGRPVAGWHLQIDPQRRLWARGPGQMIGYLNDPQATAAKVQDGWLATGDLAEVDSDGCWRILGRHDETIVLSSGWKVHPLAIEQRLARVDGVDLAVLFGDGRRLGVIVQLSPVAMGVQRLSPTQLQARFDEALADRPKYQRPERVLLLPRPLSAEAGELTAKGTVRRAAVIARWAPHSHHDA